MWLVTKNPHKQEIYDKLWGAFGALFLGPEQYIFMPIAHGRGTGDENRLLSSHAQGILDELSESHGMDFFLSASAAWSFWLARNSCSTLEKESQVYCFSKEDFLKELSQARLSLMKDFFADSLNGVQGELKWDSYLSFLSAKGFKNSLELLNVADHQEYLLKYGFWWRKLIGLLTATIDFQLDSFVPALNLQDQLIFNERDFMGQLYRTFLKWEKRLKSRRAVISGVQLVFSDYRQKKKLVTLCFDEGIQSCQTMFRSFYRKWEQLNKTQFVNFDFKWVDVKSFELHPQESIQLSLLSEGEYSFPEALLEDDQQFIEEFRRAHVA